MKKDLEMRKLYGNCNCGKISFEINKDDIKRVINCHCNLCRKMNGAVFSTYVAVLDSGFKLLQGENNICRYQVSQNAHKHFCSTCGTPIYNKNHHKYNGITIVHFGAINNSEELKPVANIFCESKLFWLDEIFSIKNFDQARN